MILSRTIDQLEEPDFIITKSLQVSNSDRWFYQQWLLGEPLEFPLQRLQDDQ